MGGSEILQFIIAGLTMGAIYAFVALGFTLIFNATGIVNFAQGEFVMLGGMIAAGFYNWLGWPLIVSLLAAIGITSLVGLGIERATIHPCRNAPVIQLILITLGLSIVIQQVALLVWGTDPLSLPYFSRTQPILLGEVTISTQSIWVIGLVLVCMVMLQVFFKRSKWGRAMLATSINRQAAASVGIDIDTVTMLAFVLAALLGGIGGVLVTPITTTSYRVGFLMSLKGFAAAILGGMGNTVGAVVGGLTLGILEALGTGLISSGYKDAIALSILIVFLVVRPVGILGAKLRSN